MVNWQRFTLDSVQAVMFTPDHSAFVGSRVVAAMLRQFGEQFNGDMQVLPNPPDMPEFPTVILQSSDGSRTVSAAPARFGSVWKRSGAAEAITLDKATRQCVEVLEYYVREMRVRVERLGLVVHRICLDENPAQTLIQRFCTAESQREPFNRSATFEIHNHKEYKPVSAGVDYPINSWVRCKCGITGPEKIPAIVVMQDINTVPGKFEQCQPDAQEIDGFFSMASNEAEMIIKKYFPERE